MVIYLDLVMVLNFLVDLLLLLGTNRLSGFPPGWRRILPAAALGSLYAGICLLPGMGFLGGCFWRTVFLGLMGWWAFGWNPGGWRRSAVFLVLSLALGGAVSRGSGFSALILGAGGLWLLCRVAFQGSVGGSEYLPLHVGGLSLTALRDTGNTLKDPISGEAVLVISGDYSEALAGLSRDQLAHPLETLAARAVPGLRLIPYCAVGRGSGMLLAKRFSDVKLGNVTRDALVAFAPEGLGKNQMYQALAGGIL